MDAILSRELFRTLNEVSEKSQLGYRGEIALHAYADGRTSMCGYWGGLKKISYYFFRLDRNKKKQI